MLYEVNGAVGLFLSQESGYYLLREGPSSSSRRAAASIQAGQNQKPSTISTPASSRVKQQPQPPWL